MNILYLSLRFPYPPHSGDKIRTYNVLRHLSNRHSISFISFIQSPEETRYIGKIQDFCKDVTTVKFSKTRAYSNCIMSSLSEEPFQVAYWHSPEMQKTIDNLIEKNGFNLVHVQFFRMAQYVMRYIDKPKVLDSGDSFWLNLSRRSKLDRSLAWPLLKLEASKVKLYETQIAKWFNHVTMVSPLDMQCLLSNDSNLTISVVPMGVDIDYYQPSSSNYGTNLLFTGTIRYFPNKDAVLYFYKQIFPLVKSVIPDAKFYVVGNYPPKNIVKLATNDDIIVTGHVEDVRPYFDKSAVFVCPLRSGSGMQTKILEAMAMGVPVVTTSIGATALEAVDGRDIIVADDIKIFSEKIIELIKNSDFRNYIAKNARKLVEEKYEWSEVVQRFDEIYKSIKAMETQ
ncbi:MAG: TIGR03087 family PEP-CTERM/XrtA system glycosyltransferase [Candidatus Poribacteria bacterium]